MRIKRLPNCPQGILTICNQLGNIVAMLTPDALLACLYDGPIPDRKRDLARVEGDRFVAGWLGLTPQELTAMRYQSTDDGTRRVTGPVRRESAARARDQVHARMARALAEETLRTGRCTEADLARRGFTGAEIAAHGDRARELAARRRPDLADPERAGEIAS